MARLHPRDLLSLSRVSRHLRGILMSRSSRGMWIAARKNAQNPPPPPDELSEPKYASVLFERDCQASTSDHICTSDADPMYLQACGISRAGKENFAMSLRLCAACWKEKFVVIYNVLPDCQPRITSSVFTKRNTLQNFKELKPLADRLFPLFTPLSEFFTWQPPAGNRRQLI